MKTNESEEQESFARLIAEAWRVREYAYAPYSGFAVGAAVEAVSGQIYGGCNIENVSYGLTNCAERTAIFSAVTHGERQLVRMVICADTPEPVAPCGACRQVMVETEMRSGAPIRILLCGRESATLFNGISSLLPYCFDSF